MAGTAEAPLRLRALDLFADCDDDHLGRVESRLGLHRAAHSEVLLRQGEPASWFGLILAGEVAVDRADGERTRRLAVAGPGSMVGELALLRQAARSATVTAQGPVELLRGDRDALTELLALPGVQQRVTKQAAQKLAAQVQPISVTSAQGQAYCIRPLLPTDRAGLEQGIDHLSEESRRKRFFTGGKVSGRIVDYLLDLDYTNHFAWVVFPDDDHRMGVGVSRYIRHRDEPGTAELAVAVVDEHQGKGLGKLLVGALAVAAQAAGVQRFTASALNENRAVMELLGRAGARWLRSEPGVSETSVDSAELMTTLPSDLAAQLREVAAATMSASQVPLA